MKYPKMIIFDYGHTLCYESYFDSGLGSEALLKHAVSNKNNLNAVEVSAFSQQLFAQFQAVRQMGVEVHEHQFSRLLYEYLEIELALSPLEAETVFWDAAAPGELMPHAADMLRFIKAKEIHSGVISNISFSGKALSSRIEKLLPDHHFEFILASSEYGIRKPNALLFELALKKAGLSPDEVWFCGDNVHADIEGAARVGIYPIWFTSPLECPYRTNSLIDTPECDHRQISDWRELIELVDALA
ncbi:MAG: HAD family hydrolase [Bacillota bacterium]|nr:HAD family hydrolase [Bacillota bacterium]